MNSFRGAASLMADDRTPSVFDLTRDASSDDKKDRDNDSAFPSLKRRPAEERAKEIVDDLKEVILNPGRTDGKTGMRVGDWTKRARKDITKAIRDAETSAAFRELMSANRIGGLCVRIGFLLMAAVASFFSFWYGIVFIGREYGPLWGFGATMSALGLSLAFVIAGLVYGSENKEQARDKAKSRFEK
ncbi:hypothetical protein [Nisaea sp.]|uniref:hypothetical protein n=1 Tax=Nisaea sp. TaxID=2024842 RepID=UPI002B2707EF|nr:hypothetical protein [Nisaea sp.]